MNFIKHGAPPYKTALIHGGPGAAGELAPLAEELRGGIGILEPLQTASSLDGQVEELRSVLESECSGPAVLAGFSWGAWLSLILAARYPALVKKLVLISSGPFEEKYAHSVSERRFARLSAAGRAEAGELLKLLEDPRASGRSGAFKRLEEILSGTDAYDPEPVKRGMAGNLIMDVDIFQKVWKDAAEFRRGGGLIECAARVKCPVTAIHGDYDPHPADGVRVPLNAAVKDFKFILLKECGHRPWIEKKARDKFYEILKAELSVS